MNSYQELIGGILRRAWVASVVALMFCRPSLAPGQTVVFTQVPATAPQEGAEGAAPFLLSNRYPDGARLMSIPLGDGRSEPTCILSDFVAAADPAVSFDGRSLLFAGKKNGRLWQIYELNVASGQTRQVARWQGDCWMPTYLPDGNIVFASPGVRTGKPSTAAQDKSWSGCLSLYCLHPGGVVSRLTFAPGVQAEPAILNDGRIVYVSRSLPEQPGGHVPSALFLINTDGTGVQGLADMGAPPWLMRSPAVGIDGRIAYVAADRLRPFAAGQMRLLSLNDTTGNHTVAVGEELGLVADVAPMPAAESSRNASEQDWLLSMRPTDGPTFALYRFDGKKVTPLYADPQWHALEPVALVRRVRPHARQSIVDPTLNWGELLCQNVYNTSPRLAERISPGRVARVRVLEGLFRTNRARPPRPAAAQLVPPPATPVRILGEAPVESDGSFFAKVPANRPLRLQLIDQEGFVAVNQKSWSWVRPKEGRLCTGCHADRELAFDNTAPLALKRPPADLTDPAKWRLISFKRDVLPVLATTCGVSECHRPPEPTAGMNFSKAQQVSDGEPPWVKRVGPALSKLMAVQPGKPPSVGGRLIHPGNARRSPIMWVLYGRQLGRAYDAAPFDRQVTEPHLDEELPKETLALIRTWIEIGAPYEYGPPESAAGELHSKRKIK